jgi:hypothetical protein
LDKRAVKGNRGAADNGTADNKGSVYKEIRPVKLDFSATNFKAKVTGWRLSIEKKADTLFPAVSDRARSIAGISAASHGFVDSTHQDPQILARANLASEDEEDTAAEDVVDERHDNRLRGASHDNDHDSDDGHDNRGDNRVESEEDGNGGGVNEIEEADDENSDDNTSTNDEDHDETEEEPEGSDLTEIGSN